MNNTNFSSITPQIEQYAKDYKVNGAINPELYNQNKVFRGLRDVNGKGVLTGLTAISEVKAKEIINGEEVPCLGELYYRGYNVEQLVNGFIADNRFGFEETTYLLLFGSLPNKEELKTFNKILARSRTLPSSFVRDLIMKAPTNDMMNSLARSVLALYSYDNDADNISIENVLRQSLELISTFPMLSLYGYQAYEYYLNGSKSFFIHEPEAHLSTAENILHMLRIDSKYTKLEAQLLDLCLILHAEHGGGNNSSFTTHVVSSSGTDTYSAIAAALGSLKGPKHGGANIKVMHMIDNIKENVKDWSDKEELYEYLKKMLRKEVFDNSGLIYGIGHAVYSLSDPRAGILKGFVEQLAAEKGLKDEYALYALIEEIAPVVIGEERKIYKGVNANVDFYSGFVYSMLGLPRELFTPLFAISRISGWSAHRMEELLNASKIIRPAYKAVQGHNDYVSLENR